MAERFRLALPAGERASRRLEWADPRGGSSSRLGTLDWSVNVLPPEGGGELTVELKVSVQLGPQELTVELQMPSIGRTFQGSFDPAKNPRFATPGGSDTSKVEVEAVIFEFSNAFSWWTPKQVDLFLLRKRPPGLPFSHVPPLPALRVPSPLPRGQRTADGTAETVAALAAAPELRGLGCSRAEDFAAHLDACLAAAEEQQPRCKDAWLEHLDARIATLRGLCQRVPRNGFISRHEFGSDYGLVSAGLAIPEPP
mmetsp:Transcript_74818/g.241916  ORF Transcript_74818/g.241916 Transcript_74818/m.241916 type:complete len:254 (+) Transcript_74818:80-841(+)